MDTKLIGSKIAQARKASNLKQSELAEQLFISPQAVGKWERGESFPDIITFGRLAKILGVDLNYFSTEFETTPQPEQIPLATKQEVTEPTESKQNWNMSRGNWVDADFSGLKNLHQTFSGANLQRSQFIDSDLSGLTMKGNNIENCDFRGSKIISSHLNNCNIDKNLFNDCSLKETRFDGCHIQNCNFTSADFTNASLNGCSFEKSKVKSAVFNRTSFSRSHFAQIIFEGIIENCKFEDCAFQKVTFQNTRLLNTFFKGENLKRVIFIDCEADRLTYEFLKSGKANLSGVALVDQ